MLRYEGCNFFRQRLVLATLSGRPLRIKKIRADHDDPGVKGDTTVVNHARAQACSHYIL